MLVGRKPKDTKDSHPKNVQLPNLVTLGDNPTIDDNCGQLAKHPSPIVVNSGQLNETE
jgi:hypothetical protein